MDLSAASGFWSNFCLLAEVRWQVFKSVLSSNTQKKFELGFRIFAWLLLAATALIVGFVFFGAVYALLRRSSSVLAVSLWVVFLAWQLIPVLFETFAPNLEFSEIARYPISFPLFYSLNLVYGLLEPAAMAALFWLAMIWMAVLLVEPLQALRALLVFPLFALMCLLLNRALMEWVQRVISTRRGRAAISILLAMLGLSSQLLSFRIEPTWLKQNLGFLAEIWRFLTQYSPPGMGAQGIARGGTWLVAATGSLLGAAILIALFLRRQLWRIYSGENRSESKRYGATGPVEPGWKLPLLPSQVAIIAEKEIRCMMKNPMLLMNMVMMWGFVLIFAAANDFGRRTFGITSSARAAYFYPGAMMYSLLGLSNLAFNSFGGDPPGFQRWFLLPLSRQSLLRGKNAALLAITLTNWLVVTGIVSMFLKVTALQAITMLILSAYILLGFLSVGNLLSVWFPKRIKEQRWQAKNISEAAVVASMLLFAALAGSCAALFFAQQHWHLPGLAAAALFVMCVVLWFVYQVMVDVAARRMERQAEKILQELG
jgi:hypothetical protein